MAELRYSCNAILVSFQVQYHENLAKWQHPASVWLDAYYNTVIEHSRIQCFTSGRS